MNEVANTAMTKIKIFAENMFKDSMIHYHEDNQDTKTKKADGNARLIIDQNLFIIRES
jgi:hypothetical protein